jgi:hypothetical protein
MIPPQLLGEQHGVLLLDQPPRIRLISPFFITAQLDMRKHTLPLNSTQAPAFHHFELLRKYYFYVSIAFGPKSAGEWVHESLSKWVKGIQYGTLRGRPRMLCFRHYSYPS